MNIERDMGGSDTATKIVRFFVPYWISNDTSLQLVYRVVEIEPLGNVQSETVSMTKTVKSANLPLKHSPKTIDAPISTPRKDSQILERIEDSGRSIVMLSPQDYMGRSGILTFSSRNDPSLSPRVGVSVAVRDSEYFSTGISLTELENKVWCMLNVSIADLYSIHELLIINVFLTISNIEKMLTSTGEDRC